MYIYKITRNKNGKYYIGKKEDKPEDSTNYYGSGLIIKRIIKKDGKKNLTKDILMNNVNSKEQLCYYEKFWIKVLHAQDIKYGYNIHQGGTGGDTFTNNPNKEEIRKKFKNKRLSLETKNKIGYAARNCSLLTRIKLSNASKGNKRNLGRIKPLETIEKIRKSMLGKNKNPLTDEHKKNISINAANNDNYGFKNKLHSEETKRKMVKIKFERWAVKKHLKLLQKINSLQIIFPERYSDVAIKRYFKPNIKAQLFLKDL